MFTVRNERSVAYFPGQPSQVKVVETDHDHTVVVYVPSSNEPVSRVRFSGPNAHADAHDYAKSFFGETTARTEGGRI